jgi:Protein of unknown function (DUF3237)
VLKVGSTRAGLVIGVAGGGTFEGSRLKGRVLEGGSDWQRVMPDGSLRLDCRVVLKTTDDELIAMTYRGFRAGSADVLARLSTGAAVAPDEYYLRVDPTFETGSSKLDWLNRIVSVGRGRRLPSGPTYEIFEIM